MQFCRGTQKEIRCSFVFVFALAQFSLALFTFAIAPAAWAESFGSIGVETRSYFDASDQSGSVFVQPEWSFENDNATLFTSIELFARYDSLDDERSHADIREALITYVPSSWEFSLGIGKVFWGVTESNHLVDVINQSDFASNTDGETKLGQPMLKASTAQDWGIIDLFILPYFRERRFPGVDSPLTGDFVLEQTRYQSSAEQEHIDFAIRYSQYIGNWDIGLYYFDGTNRDAKIIADNSPQMLALYYDQVTHAGISLQATIGAWLWKLEAIHRNDSLEDFNAVAAGFEYTLFGVKDSPADVGLLLEYNFDSRQNSLNAPALQDDVFFGTRLTLNDVQDTNFLMGVSQDLEFSDSRLLFIEANRRLGESFRFTIDARVFESDTPADPLFILSQGDYASVTLEYFY